MLRRIFVGLAAFQLLTGNAALADTSDAANIRSLRASALQHCAQGQIEIGLKSFGDAIRLAEKSFGKDSTYVADLCFDAGVAAMKKDQYHDAENYLTKAVGLNPNATEARLKLAEFYKLKGRLGDAKTQLEKVLAHDPVNVEARELLALTYQKEGNAARATEECWRLEQIAAQKPNEFTIAQVAPLPAMPVSTTAPPVTTGNLGTFSRLAPKTPEAATSKPEEQKPATPPAAPAKTSPAAPAPAAAKAPPAAKPAPPVPQRSSKRTKKERERSKKETKKDRRHHNRQVQQAPPPEETSAFGTQARLHSKAKILNAAKNIKHSSSDEDAAAAPPPVSQPPPPTRRVRTPKGMVPPPPPVVPVFQAPAPMAPPPKAAAPQPKPAAPAPKLQQATPKEDPGEETHGSPFSRSSGSAGSSSSSSSSDDDGDFLLDWAGKKKKKGK